MTPLTLVDRRTYNLLMAHAWDRIDEDVEHAIPKAALRGTHKGNERLSDTIRRLMGGPGRGAHHPRRQALHPSIHLAAGTVSTGRRMSEERRQRSITASRADMREIIRESSIFARLQTEVMFCFSSKYALALWEMIQKRGNLKHKNTDEFTPDELRKMLGVPRGKLKEFSHFRQQGADPGGGGGQRVVEPSWSSSMRSAMAGRWSSCG